MSTHVTVAAFRTAVTKYNERPEIPGDTLPILRQLIEMCWHGDFNQRPSFKEIIQSIDEILLQLAIQNSDAQNFWRKHFLTPKQVTSQSV
jgi:hypothetical protein